MYDKYMSCRGASFLRVHFTRILLLLLILFSSVEVVVGWTFAQGRLRSPC